MTLRLDFLQLFYRCMLGWGGIGAVGGLWFSGKSGGLSFGFGFATIALILGLWDITLRFRLKPTRRSVIWEMLLIMGRYGLIGGFVYALTQMADLSWPWYFAGTATLVPALLTAVALDKETDPPT